MHLSHVVALTTRSTNVSRCSTYSIVLLRPALNEGAGKPGDCPERQVLRAGDIKIKYFFNIRYFFLGFIN